MKFTPLPNTMLLVSLLGLIIIGFTYKSLGQFQSWGFTFIVIFLIFVTASFISITPGKNEFKD